MAEADCTWLHRIVSTKKNTMYLFPELENELQIQKCVMARLATLGDLYKLLQFKLPAEPLPFMQFPHISVAPGQRLYHAGENLVSVFCVLTGCLKVDMTDEWANHAIVRFPIKGDIIGLPGIPSKKYTGDVIALTPCKLIMIPLSKLQTLCQEVPSFQNGLNEKIYDTIRNAQTTLRVLCSLGSEARVAHFLYTLSKNYERIGYCEKRFMLPMSRQEIGAHLGLSLETVSRAFSGLKTQGLISINGREIKINNADRLKSICAKDSSAKRIPAPPFPALQKGKNVSPPAQPPCE